MYMDVYTYMYTTTVWGGGVGEGWLLRQGLAR